MYRIDSIHDTALEAFFQARRENKVERWMAAFAWWFYRQHIGNAQDYWAATAGKLTAALPDADRSAVSAQLSKAEEAFVAQAPSEWPETPQHLVAYISAWDPVAPTIDISVLRSDAVAKVNREAALQRSQYLTPGIGMDLVYGKKLEEARAKLTNPSIANDKVGHIVDEAELNGVSIAVAAQFIIDTEEQWATVSRPIEKKRMAAKKAIAEAQTAEEVAAAANVNWVGMGE